MTCSIQTRKETHLTDSYRYHWPLLGISGNTYDTIKARTKSHKVCVYTENLFTTKQIRQTE